jgi:hypothetical protein
MHKQIPTDSLIITGLARDNEKSLRKYVEEHNIPYPNAIVSDSLLKDYGIMSFPTTLLIGPDGAILDKNLGGNRLTSLVREHLNSYYQDN